MCEWPPLTGLRYERPITPYGFSAQSGGEIISDPPIISLGHEGVAALTRWNIRSHHHCLWRLALVSMIGEEGAVLESTERGATDVFGKTETQKGKKTLVATKQKTN